MHQFLPDDVPVGSDWVPRPGWRSVYATFLRVAGAILVGLGLGSVTGLLPTRGALTQVALEV